MSWPTNHIKRNSFFFLFYGPMANLRKHIHADCLTKEEKKKVQEAYAILRDLHENRFKRYWELKEENRNKNG